MHRKSNNNAGFTLIEAMFAVMIVGFAVTALMLLLVPALIAITEDFKAAFFTTRKEATANAG